MLLSRQDIETRAAVKLRKILEGGGKEARTIIDGFEKMVLEEMSVSAEHLLYTLDLLFKCESLHTTEKFIVLDVFHELLEDLIERGEEVKLGDIAQSLLRMKFLKNEKHVERAVVVYLNSILLLLRVANTEENRNSIFRIFCTLYMSRSFITNTRCGYLIPPMFRRFLKDHPDYVEKLLENEDKLMGCFPLLETTLSSCARMNTVLSRLVVLDSIRRKNSSLVLSAQGKGFLDPFYFQMYVDRENETFSELSAIFAQKNILEYLLLDVSLRLTSRKTLEKVGEKILGTGVKYMIRMLKEPDMSEECGYCNVSRSLEKKIRTKQSLEEALEEFNAKGNVERVAAETRDLGEDAEKALVLAAQFLRAHANTNLTMLGKCLGEEKNKSFLEAFCKSFNFQNYDILSALRVFLLSFNLPKEGQKIERVMYEFCRKFSEDENQSLETCLSIAMPVLFLNTSLHNVNTVKKTTVEEFTSIILADCPEVSMEGLRSIYDSIKNNELQFPTTNDAFDNLDFLASQSEADEKLHRGYLPPLLGRYCGRCTRNVYFHIFEAFDLRRRVAEMGSAAEVKEFVKACMRLNTRKTAYETIECIKDTEVVLELCHLYRKEIQHVWRHFLRALLRTTLEKEESAGSGRFFGLFAFGKEIKKEKKENYSEAMLEETLEETGTVPDHELAAMAELLEKEIEQNRMKIFYKTGYYLILRNAHRIQITSRLFEQIIGGGGFSAKELFSISRASSLTEFLVLMASIQYRPSKHVADSVLSVLQFVTQHFSKEEASEEEMERAEKWLIALVRSEALRYRGQEIVGGIWAKVEALTMRLDRLGHDSFEVLIKLKDSLRAESRIEIAENTKMYYRNINRMLLCLDILQHTGSKEFETAMLKLVEGVLEKDPKNMVEILESCENVLEKTSINEAVEELVYRKIGEGGDHKTRYTERITKRITDKKLAKQKIVEI